MGIHQTKKDWPALTKHMLLLACQIRHLTADRCSSVPGSAVTIGQHQLSQITVALV